MNRSMQRYWTTADVVPIVAVFAGGTSFAGYVAYRNLYAQPNRPHFTRRNLHVRKSAELASDNPLLMKQSFAQEKKSATVDCLLPPYDLFME
eukprot:TRINITY_DN89013_c0_g1_i1.p1 TRINITY_DN89013_c0_g1~~TRINITY_DN89013_c0_g1_i1.p1  ORF type:complete len:102 (+),score=1.31 TRINITY_DN89013_c0_g1_i1:33-308(+)